MDGLLTEVKTVTHDRESPLSIAKESSVSELERHGATPKADLNADPTSDYILAALKSKPDRPELSHILSVLDPSNRRIKIPGFDIRVPSPTTAQILNALGSITLPDHWASLDARSKGQTAEDTKLRGALLRCFSSVPGVSCLVTQLRSDIAASRSSSRHANASRSQIQIREILAFISALLKPKDLILRLHTDIEALYTNATQKQITWREFLSLIAASRVLSTTAEALTLAGESTNLTSISWVGDGPQYASWLGTNICHMSSKIGSDNQGAWKAVASLTGRALSLGYTGNFVAPLLILLLISLSDQLVRGIYTGLLINETLREPYSSLFDNLRPTEQLAVLEATFRDIEKKYFLSPLINDGNDGITGQAVSGVAALCSIVVDKRQILQTHLLDWLSKGQGGSVQTIGLRRALLAVFADQKGNTGSLRLCRLLLTSHHTDLMTTLLTKSLDQSSDKFYINHAPIVSQEGTFSLWLVT
jgi:telomere length regulation protein